MTKKVNMKNVSSRAKNKMVTGYLRDAHIISSYSKDYEGKEPGVSFPTMSKKLKKYKKKR